MVSLNTTAGNSAVLASLRQINRDIATNQTRIGTGLKINKASDNPALFATAQTIRSDIKKQEGLSANIGIAKAKFDAANAGLDKITDIINKIKDVSDAATASDTGATLTAATGKVTSYLAQIAGIAASSGFKGTNLLTSTTAVDVVLSTETSAKITFTPADITAATGVAALTAAAVATAPNIVALSALATTALGEVASYQAQISAFGETVASQLDFQTTLKGINEAALGSLVDANLEEESAKSSALQVKQQLAYQALSIGNNSAQNILRLFQ